MILTYVTNCLYFLNVLCFFFYGSSIPIFFLYNFLCSFIKHRERFLGEPIFSILFFGDLHVLHRDGQPIVAELINLVNTIIIFLSIANLLNLFTIPLASLTVKLVALLFWINLQLLIQGLVLHWPALD